MCCSILEMGTEKFGEKGWEHETVHGGLKPANSESVEGSVREKGTRVLSHFQSYYSFS